MERSLISYNNKYQVYSFLNIRQSSMNENNSEMITCNVYILLGFTNHTTLKSILFYFQWFFNVCAKK